MVFSLHRIPKEWFKHPEAATKSPVDEVDEQKVSKTKEVKWKHTDTAPIGQWQKWECEMETEVSNSTNTDMKMICICDITSYVEIGRRRITGPSAVHGNTFVFPLVRLLAVLNLQSPCAED